MAALRGRHRQGNCSWGADPLADQTAGRKATTVTKLCRHHLADVEVGRLQLPVNVDIMDRVEHLLPHDLDQGHDHLADLGWIVLFR